MPVIYRAVCAACRHSEAMADQWMAVRLRSGVIEVLPHPLEGSRLQELGFTFEQARAEDRLLHYTKLACDGCGSPAGVEAMDPRARHFQPEGTALVWWPIAAVAVTGASFTLLFDIEWYWRALMAPGYAILSVIVAFALWTRMNELRHRFRKKSPPTSDLPCDNCGAGRLHLLGAIAGLSLPCPKCSERRFVYDTIGIS